MKVLFWLTSYFLQTTNFTLVRPDTNVFSFWLVPVRTNPSTFQPGVPWRAREGSAPLLKSREFLEAQPPSTEHKVDWVNS